MSITTEPAQGSAEWHRWRSQGIGASEIAAVLGICKWSTAYQLWLEKTGRGNGRFEHDGLRTGKRLEPAARFDFEMETGLAVDTSRTLYECPDHPHIRASLDGIAGDAVVEIKCPGEAQYQKLREAVPDYYMAQVQQQMLCTGLKRALFWVWHPKHGGVLHEIDASEEWQQRIIAAADEFWQWVESDEWPEDEITSLAEALALAKQAEDEAKQARIEAEQAVIAAMHKSGARKIENGRYKISLVSRQTVDRKRLADDPDYQPIAQQMDALKEQVKEIEARYKTPGAEYIRLTEVEA